MTLVSMRTGLSSGLIAATCGLAALATGGGPSGAVSAAPGEPVFEAAVLPIGEALAAEMNGVSWHPGCPVPISDLRLITMNHWGFDGAVHDGELVVHADVADDIVSVFERIFDARFPILRMERVDAYGGDDDESMAADNTSAFNCREVTGGGAYSRHSWGVAIDINPLENPYVRGNTVLPAAGVEYLDRADDRPGMIVDGDVVVQAFAAIGFIWGGDWTQLHDYQHFEAEDRTIGASGPARTCPIYTENPGRYPVRLCQRGVAVENVQVQLVRHEYTVEIDGYFGPQTLAAVRRFQSDHGLEPDGLVGPATWPALLAGANLGADADGDGAIEPWEIPGPTPAPTCANPPPSSDSWSGAAHPFVHPNTGDMDTMPFNQFLTTADTAISTSPCNAAVVLLHLDRPTQDGETVTVVAQPENVTNATVSVTFDHLADDSVAALRYVLSFEDRGDGTIRLVSGVRSQRCQPGRGHDDFSTELCV